MAPSKEFLNKLNEWTSGNFGTLKVSPEGSLKTVALEWGQIRMMTKPRSFRPFFVFLKQIKAEKFFFPPSFLPFFLFLLASFLPICLSPLFPPLSPFSPLPFLLFLLLPSSSSSSFKNILLRLFPCLCHFYPSHSETDGVSRGWSDRHPRWPLHSAFLHLYL